jgi:hypothetical protein
VDTNLLIIVTGLGRGGHGLHVYFEGLFLFEEGGFIDGDGVAEIGEAFFKRVADFAFC